MLKYPDTVIINNSRYKPNEDQGLEIDCWPYVYLLEHKKC